jgi:hypothetical protein
MKRCTGDDSAGRIGDSPGNGSAIGLGERENQSDENHEKQSYERATAWQVRTHEKTSLFFSLEG